MNKKRMQDQLQESRQTAEQKITRYQEKIGQIEKEQSALRLQIATLNKTLQQLHNDHQSIKVKVEKTRQQHTQSDLAIVFNALTQSAVDITKYALYIQKVKETQEAIRQQYPDMTQEKWNEFRQFEKNPEVVLQSLPKSYREPVRRYHETLAQQLRPLRELTSIKPEIHLTLVMLLDLENSLQTWILPIQSDIEDMQEATKAQLDIMLKDIQNNILALARDKNWFFADIDNESELWSGFQTTTILMEYSGQESITTHAHSLLQESLKKSKFFKNAIITIEIVEIRPEVFELGNTIAISEDKIHEEKISLSERSQGWYRDEDVVTWNRPLKTTKGSTWNVQGRRLRTMLINMIAEGKIGGDAVAASLLWQPLPQVHASAMQQGIQHLVSQNVLQEVPPYTQSDDIFLTLNPDKLSLVQSLLNRDMTDFWQQVTTMDTSGVQIM